MIAFSSNIELCWLVIDEVWIAKEMLAFNVEVREVSIQFSCLGSILEHLISWWEPTLSLMLSWYCMNKASVVGKVVGHGVL